MTAEDQADMEQAAMMSPALDPYRGLAVAYGFGALYDIRMEEGGFSSGLVASYRFTRMLGVGGIALFGHYGDDDPPANLFAAGLHIGRRFYGEPGLGMLYAGEEDEEEDEEGYPLTVTRMARTLALSGGIGAFIKLNDWMSLAPRGLFAVGINGAVTVYATIGVGVYVARRND